MEGQPSVVLAIIAIVFSTTALISAVVVYIITARLYRLSQLNIISAHAALDESEKMVEAWRVARRRDAGNDN